MVKRKSEAIEDASFLDVMKLSIQYVRAETIRHGRSFLIGLFTVILVVFCIAFLTNAVSHAPLIFLKLAENSVGENDIIMTPGLGVAKKRVVFGEGLPILNQTYISNELDNNEVVQGTSGRWVLVGRLLNDEDTARNASSLLLGMNSRQEAAIGIGRGWDRPPLAPDQCYISQTIARQIGVDREGAKVVVELNLFDMASTLKVVSEGNGGTVAASEAGDTSSNGAKGGDGVREEGRSTVPTEVRNLQGVLDTVSPGLWSAPTTLVNQSQWENFNVSDALRRVELQRNIDPGTRLNVTQQVADILSSLTGLTITLPEIEAINLLNQGRDVEVDVMVPGYEAYPQYAIPIITTNGGILAVREMADKLWARSNLNHSWPLTNGDVITLLYPLYRDRFHYRMNYTVASVVESPDGKWPASLGSVLVVESETLLAGLRTWARSLLDMTESVTIGGTGIGGDIRDLLQRQNDGSLLLDARSLPNRTIDLSPLGLGIGSLTVPSLLDAVRERGLRVDNPVGLAGAANNQTRDQLREIRRNIDSLSPDAYSLISVVQFRDRVAAYLKNLEDMNADLIRYTNAVASSLGVAFPATLDTPIAMTLEKTIYIRYFLDNIFASVIVLLVLLGILLIYSLLLNDVETKTYEYGMLRALGMPHKVLINILSIKAMTFAVPGVFLGLVCAYIANWPIAHRISEFASLASDYSFTQTSIIVAVVIGILMPLVSNIVPIRRALGRTLRDSLDVYHHVVNDITIRVVKLSELGLDLWQTSLALLMLVIGFVVFYVIPYAFTFKKIPIFLGILNGILCGMLIGLCVVAQTVQPRLERVVLWCILWGKHRPLQNLIRKNLAGHRKRNRKTAQMFTLCLAFIIFSGAMFSLQERSLSDDIRSFLGADLSVAAPSMKDSLRVEQMSEYLDTQRVEKGGLVVDYTYITFNLDWNQAVWDVKFSNLPGFPQMGNFMYGVQKNYLNVAFSDFFVLQERSSGRDPPLTRQGEVDAIALLYTDRGNARLPEEKNQESIVVPASVRSGFGTPRLGDANLYDAGGRRLNQTLPKEEVDAQAQEIMEEAYLRYIDIITSEALREYASVTTDTPLDIKMSAFNPRSSRHQVYHYLCKSRGMVSKVPGFFYSSYRQTATFASLLMRVDSYLRILNEAADFVQLPRVTKAPMQRLLVRVHDDASVEQRDDILNGLRQFFRSDDVIAMNTEKLIRNVNEAVALLRLFFLLIALIAMTMCFFILWLSFSANVTENAWEFGVLRAIGINSRQVVFVYIYEALSLVFSSVILGSLIGIAIAVSLTLQFNLFTEMPFHLSFPYVLFSALLAMAFIVAVLGSYLPAHSFNKNTISNIIRRA